MIPVADGCVLVWVGAGLLVLAGVRVGVGTGLDVTSVLLDGGAVTVVVVVVGIGATNVTGVTRVPDTDRDALRLGAACGTRLCPRAGAAALATTNAGTARTPATSGTAAALAAAGLEPPLVGLPRAAVDVESLPSHDAPANRTAQMKAIGRSARGSGGP